MSLEQEVVVIFRNVVDCTLFSRSLSEFFLFMDGEEPKNLQVTEKDVLFVLGNVYGCHPPSSEIKDETRQSFVKQRHIAEYTPQALQKMSDFVQWRMENKTEVSLEWTKDKFEEKAKTSLYLLQKRIGQNSVPSCILAAALLSGSARDFQYRQELYQLVLNSRKNAFARWAKKTYGLAISPRDVIYSSVEKVVVKILEKHRSKVLDSRIEFWSSD